MQKYETARKLIFLAFVRKNNKTYLLKDAISGKLDLESSISIEVVYCHRCYLHYIPNIEQVEPFTLVQVAKDSLHVQPRLS